MRRSEELAQLAPKTRNICRCSGQSAFKDSITYVPATAAITPDMRADAVAKSINVCKEANLEAAGYLENTTEFNAVVNSKGLFAYNNNTDVIFSITTRNEAGTGSGMQQEATMISANWILIPLPKLLLLKPMVQLVQEP